ncbi:MAG TPA: cysteine peptidase family C39 domain-containing protein [Patescibacteria group bacterium]|nr:cysteine peptidase family C39 domain-containing protein [Patescibacteria group bacterium]
MKPLQPFRQTPGLCGPASLKILLSHYGKDFSEQELAGLCEATVEQGTDHEKLIKAVQVIGEKAYAKSGGTIDEIREYTRKNIPVIVGWWSTDGDHFSVVYHADRKSIWMMDPELDEGIRKMSIEEFEHVWYDFDGPENVRVDRWMMALEKK